MDEFVKVGKLGDFPEGRGRRVRVNHVDVALFRAGAELFALRDACPHMGTSLAEGRIDHGRVVCRQHGWRFDLRSGRSDRRSAARCAIYRVRLDGEDVWVGPPLSRPEGDVPEDEPSWVRLHPDHFFRKRRD